MSTWDNFSTFYQNLSGFGMFVFWLFVFLFIFLMLVAIGLVLKNKELREALEDKIGQEDLLHDKIKRLEEKIKELETKSKLTRVRPEHKPSVYSYKEENEDNLVRDVPVSKPKTERKEGLYGNRNYRGQSIHSQTSPINIYRKETPIETIKETSKPKEDFEKSSNISFVEELSKKMEEEVKPQTIELTDYEKKQEDEAIISYDELMQNKDRLYQITDDEDDDGFIEELKYFRKSLP